MEINPRSVAGGRMHTSLVTVSPPWDSNGHTMIFKSDVLTTFQSREIPAFWVFMASVPDLQPELSTRCHPLYPTTREMSTPGDSDPPKGLCILSLGASTSLGTGGELRHRTDAGGSRGTSQLMILSQLMKSINSGTGTEKVVTERRPWEVFQVIGGVGSGGYVKTVDIRRQNLMHSPSPALLPSYLPCLD
jgi:hypothetical protein